MSEKHPILFSRRERPLIVSGQPRFAAPDSQLVSAAQFYEERFEYWRQIFRWEFGVNRKLWEYLYILEAMNHYVGMKPGMRALGFGVAKERIPAILAARGCEVVATDYVPGADQEATWDYMSSQSIADLRHDDLCDWEVLKSRVKFHHADMNKIPAQLAGFDCLWSCGSLEHIGGLRAGLDFIVKSLDCLNPGGYAIHTTEFNLSSNEHTIESPTISFYRRKDIEALAIELQRLGHRIVLNFDRGKDLADHHVDCAPYNYNLSIAALHGNHIITSIGLIIQKGDAT